MESIENFLIQLKGALDIPLMKLGKADITVWSVLLFLFLTILLFYSTAKFKNWIVERLLSRSKVDVGIRHTIAAIARYVFLIVGFAVILQTAGIDLSALTILIGSLSIGIGLGLQGITNNFVSGLILLFERPIRVGDRIEFKNLNGDVTKISARATTIITNDNISVIVPNSELTSTAIINWSIPNRQVRCNFPVGVSYDSDPQQVRTVLIDVANQHPGILKDPAPDVLFDNFGESSLNFILRVWTITYVAKPGVLRSELYYSISNKFKDNGIEIPFPQRDIRIRQTVQNE